MDISCITEEMPNVMDLASIGKEINNLKINKESQNSDIPTKIIKENVDIFAELLWKGLNS